MKIALLPLPDAAVLGADSWVESGGDMLNRGTSCGSCWSATCRLIGRLRCAPWPLLVVVLATGGSMNAKAVVPLVSSVVDTLEIGAVGSALVDPACEDCGGADACAFLGFSGGGDSFYLYEASSNELLHIQPSVNGPCVVQVLGGPLSEELASEVIVDGVTDGQGNVFLLAEPAGDGPYHVYLRTPLAGQTWVQSTPIPPLGFEWEEIAGHTVRVVHRARIAEDPDLQIVLFAEDRRDGEALCIAAGGAFLADNQRSFHPSGIPLATGKRIWSDGHGLQTCGFPSPSTGAPSSTASSTLIYGGFVGVDASGDTCFWDTGADGSISITFYDASGAPTRSGQLPWVVSRIPVSGKSPMILTPAGVVYRPYVVGSLMLIARVALN